MVKRIGGGRRSGPGDRLCHKWQIMAWVGKNEKIDDRRTHLRYHIFITKDFETMDKEKLLIRTKTWILDQDKSPVFGFGQLKILETIERTGSISAAAKEMKMGYRSMWGRIQKVEQRTGKTLLIRQKGGACGGKSELTDEAKLMVHQFKTLQERIHKAAQDIFEDIYFPENC